MIIEQLSPCVVAASQRSVTNRLFSSGIGGGGGGAVPSGDGHISFLDCPNVSTPAGCDAAISNTVS